MRPLQITAMPFRAVVLNHAACQDHLESYLKVQTRDLHNRPYKSEISQFFNLPQIVQVLIIMGHSGQYVENGSNPIGLNAILGEL